MGVDRRTWHQFRRTDRGNRHTQRAGTRLYADPAIELAALLKSLEKFEEQKLVSQLEIQGQLVFLLNQPLQQYSQTIQISGQAACRVASTVNNALIRSGNSEQSVNSMELNERAIEILLRLGEMAIANAD